MIAQKLFENLGKKSIMHKLCCVTSANIWKDCVQYDKLTINQQQKFDPQSSVILNNI